jgi:hypothetical protein
VRRGQSGDAASDTAIVVCRSRCGATTAARAAITAGRR